MIKSRCLINNKKEDLIKDVVSSIPVYDHIMHEDCKNKSLHKIFHLFYIHLTIRLWEKLVS